MPAGKLIFSQLTDWIHPEQFRRCVQRYAGNYKVYSFPCWDQFLAMTFAQLTYRESLADIEVCLRARSDQLYRMGFRATVAHSTLADANRVRDWRIYADLAQLLIARARRLYAQDPLQVELDQTVYAFGPVASFENVTKIEPLQECHFFVCFCSCLTRWSARRRA